MCVGVVCECCVFMTVFVGGCVGVLALLCLCGFTCLHVWVCVFAVFCLRVCLCVLFCVYFVNDVVLACLRVIVFV